jgi:iron complex outermembrane receptor protein
MRKAHYALFASAAASALLFGGSAFAGDPSANAGGGSYAVEEVVVTANKKSERLQDVAMSVSALTDAQLTRSRIIDLQDLQNQVPGLSLQQGGSASGVSTRLILRGLNTGNQGATVATIVDDVPFSISGAQGLGGLYATDIDSYDLNRIEVLKGPQGTLYGATAEGGLVKYVTNAPDPSGMHGGLELEGFDLAHGGAGGSVKGFLNLPLLDDKAALRIVGFEEYSPGWISDNLAGAKKTNDFDRSGGRFQFLWRPTADLQIKLGALIQNYRSDNNQDVQVNGNYMPTNPYALVNGYNFNTFLIQSNRSNVQIYSVDLQYDLRWAKFQSITAYGQNHYVFALDTPYYGNLFAPDTTLTQFGQYGVRKYSQEIRLSSEPDFNLFGRSVEWQVGGYFTHESAYGLSHYVTRDYPSGTAVDTPFSPMSPEIFYTDTPSTFREFAGYADATVHFSRKLDLELGGRVFNETQTGDQVEGGALFGFPIQDLGSSHSSETSGTFSVAPRFHLTPDDMIYARIASGYRPGGPEPIIPFGPPVCGSAAAAGKTCLPSQYGSDNTVNYELGFKGFALEKTVSMDIAAFYIDWSKVQINVIYPLNGAAYTITQNAGAARSYGVEWTLDWTPPVRGLDFTAVGAYTNATITQAAPGIYATAGDDLPYVSKVTSTVSVNYERPITDALTGFVGASWSYIGDRYSDFNFYTPESHSKIPAYDTFSVQLGVREKGITFEIYGKNLSDARGITSYSSGYTPLGELGSPGQASLIRPRQIGALLSLAF